MKHDHYTALTKRIYKKYMLVLDEQAKQTGRGITDNDRIYALYCCKGLVPEKMEYSVFNYPDEIMYQNKGQEALIDAAEMLFLSYEYRNGEHFLKDILAYLSKLFERIEEKNNKNT